MKWKPIANGFYEVSENGDFRRLKHGGPNTYPGKPVKIHYDRYGYPIVYFSCNGEVTKHLVHKLVAQAFIGARPKGLQVNHKDGNKKNRNFRNLEYVSQDQNMSHAIRLGLIKRGEQISNSKLSTADVREIRMANNTQAELASKFGVVQSVISSVLQNKTWRHVS